MLSDPEASFATAAIASKEIADKALRVSPGSVPASGAPQTEADKRRGKSKIWIYLAAALVAAAGIVFWLVSLGDAAKSTGGIQATLPLETFVVNLEGGGQRAYLRVGITLGLSRPLVRNGKEDIPIAPIRDAILSVLASAQAEQLLTAEGKEQLKTNLLRALSERVPQLGVENVYFTEFLVQM
ncbi:MAG TPA: flagellar basal body-associated FliL family protein [Terriglobales bacterium]|nr:flagellar basal body-associated FliL family protein [Terriglobales bacterium]